MKKIALSTLLLIGLSLGVYAGYPVSAYINSTSGLNLLDTGVYVNTGSLLSISNQNTSLFLNRYPDIPYSLQ